MTPFRLAAVLVIVCVAAACGGAGRPSPARVVTDPGPATPSVPGPSVPGPTDVPNPGPTDPGGVIVDPNRDPLPAEPVPGARNVRDVPADGLEVAVKGHNAVARLTWSSGVEPCTVLAGVRVETRDGEIMLTLREGAGPDPDVMCTAQVIRKSTLVDLGELPPGEWTILAMGDAPPVEVTIAD